MLPQLIQSCKGQGSLLLQLEEINQVAIQVNANTSVKRSFVVRGKQKSWGVQGLSDGLELSKAHLGDRPQLAG